MPSRDVTPAPTDTDNMHLLEQREHIKTLLFESDTIQEVNNATEFSNLSRPRNLPVIRDLQKAKSAMHSAVKNQATKKAGILKTNNSQLDQSIDSSTKHLKTMAMVGLSS
jgi:predicted Zn-ribbon and HTH transcriptional regulator